MCIYTLAHTHPRERALSGLSACPKFSPFDKSAKCVAELQTAITKTAVNKVSKVQK